MKKSSIIESVKPMNAGNMEFLPLDTISFSPFNYRKHVNQKDLELFAEGVKLHGVISPVTVRKINSGQYELVAGERRVRAAKMAGLSVIPAVVQELTDGAVIELQLAENMQRENPHPLDEALGINQMLKQNKTMEEIAARLGRSKQFVYSRLKLLSLIESFQQLFLEEVLTMQQALNIAALDVVGQEEVYINCCEKKKGKAVFNDEDLDYYINQCKYDLKNAPFNIKDKKLIPERGACTTCPFNTATLKTLFPEMAKEAKCSNKHCYQQKCVAHAHVKIAHAINDQQPEALVFYGEPNETVENILSTIPEAGKLPRFQYGRVHDLEKPEEPDRESYMEDEELDTASFDSDMEDYQKELQQYEKELQSGIYTKGLLISVSEVFVIWFVERSDTNHSESGAVKQTAKQVQEAIKSGTATVELLETEILRMDNREERNKELDREKVQMTIYEKLSEQLKNQWGAVEPVATDYFTISLMVYYSLDYTNRRFIDKEFGFDQSDDSQEEFYNKIGRLTKYQQSYMVRLALAGRCDAKSPRSIDGYFLYKLASEMGLPVEDIKNAQQQRAIERQEKMKKKKEVINKKMNDLIAKTTKK